ncbi:MAG: hypothetical protein GKR96_09830 [Gammaproteobacteria bacterium]|nr:hypothetical protein [Gammaproteobacteria bacterium]
MCRLLLLNHPDGIDPQRHLDAFKKICKDSPEYQGHGWGCAWLDSKDNWQFYHNILPIWDDLVDEFPKTRVFLVHARSAFRDEGIMVENNMPFEDGSNVFAFNGELRGVKIKAEGRIGAEKIFNYIKRFDKGDLATATRKGVDIINKRTRYIRAMNFFLADKQAVHICSLFSENPDYFALHTANQNGLRVVCSQPYPLLDQWNTIDNHQVLTLDTLTTEFQPSI